MKHADKQLMFGDGSYQAAQAQAQAASTTSAHMYKLQGPLKLPLKGGFVKSGLMKGGLKGALKGPIKLSPLKGPMTPAMKARLKPVLILVPRPGSKLVGGRPPVPSMFRFKDWITQMWKGG